jgi:hypothetical protein
MQRLLLGCSLLALALVTSLLGPAVAVAGQGEVVLLPPRPIDRKFPAGVFCPLPVTLTFTANSPVATIHYVAEVYADSGGTIAPTRQSIDNVFVLLESDYQAHLQPQTYGGCYLNAEVDTFFQFQDVPPTSFIFEEYFDTDPASRGWDLSSGAVWQPTYSGPNDMDNVGNTSGGSLGFTDQDATPSPADTATTEVTILGLTPGQTYRLETWWDVANFQDEDETTLTVYITSPGPTTLARKTWGRVKAGYRELTPKP